MQINLGSKLTEYLQLLKQLEYYGNVPNDLIHSFRSYALIVYRSDRQNSFSEPMPWIGIYIAIASLFCSFAMVADLIHGLRNRKLWFPCKYFTVNAASLSIIAVAMKLPMDLSNLMPGDVDQFAKIGSMGFMCTMMANLLPSLATMDSKELFTNIIALVVLVITLVVNVCIQIKTGVVSNTEVEHMLGGDHYSNYLSFYNQSIAIIYVAMILMLLMIHACSSLAIVKSKQILEVKYQSAHEAALMDQELQQPGRVLTVEKLKQHVSNYWIMAGTGSPQFMIACSATTSASGVVCALTTVLHVILMLFTVVNIKDYKSDYKWSMVMILIIQFIGSLLGTIAPLCRCFAALSFKLSIKWIWNNMKVFKVESYWTQKLSDLKESSIPFVSGSRKFKFHVHNLEALILGFCIRFQKAVVVACKIIGRIPVFIVICIFNCSCCWKWLKSMLIAFGIVFLKNSEQHETNENFSHYALQLQGDMVLAGITMKRISKSFDSLIKKAEKQEPSNLIKLLKGSTGFEGVEKFDNHHVPPLLLQEPLNCWSLPLATLTTIAISLPNIQNNIVDCLLSGVSEGLVYVKLVEESLNGIDEHVSIQKSAETLWVEVEVYNKWLGNKLQIFAPEVNTAGQILQWLRDTAKKMVVEVESTGIGVLIENSKCKSICANSMYRITESILLSYNTNIEELSQEELFVQLSVMIADILAACLTNLPQVITIKCHTSVIEKREASVHAAAQLLGETVQIINTLQDCELPCLDPDELAFIDKWRAYLKDPFP
ncbi:hypothetical protein Lser_V15G28813 [Lactuca serriola]